MVFKKAHFAGNGITVDVHIDRAHENAYLQAFVLKILVFLGFLNYHYFAVGRGNKQVFARFKTTTWVPEKLQNRDNYKRAQDIAEPVGQGNIRKKVMGNKYNDGAENQGQKQAGITFFVELHSEKFHQI